MFRRLLVVLSVVLTTFIVVQPANAQSVSLQAQAGIQITRIAQPDASHPRLRVYGYATAGKRTASLNVRFGTAGAIKWSRSTTETLSKGETFVLRSPRIECNSVRQPASVVSTPTGGWFDSDVASFHVRRSC